MCIDQSNKDHGDDDDDDDDDDDNDDWYKCVNYSKGFM